MSDQEFDNYLALLAKLLRLDGKQREAIAGELRAHLEDRLDELMAGGLLRDEAVRLALEDFGDAAGLAAQFGSISRNRRRRWLMRMTTFSAATIILVAAGLAIFWPGRNAGPGVAQVGAQDQPKPTGEEGVPADKAGTKEASTGQTLADRLNKRQDFTFVETPLKDVIDVLREQTGIQFVLDLRRLEELGVNVDTAVTRNLTQVRLSTFLDLVLDELDLVYVERDDELIFITTPENAAATMEVRVYDCRDLLEIATVGPAVPGAARGDGGGGFFGGVLRSKDILAQFGGAGAPAAGGEGGEGGLGGPMGGEAIGGAEGALGGGGGGIVTEHDLRAQRLINVITTAVDPDSWTDVGGVGSISEFGGLIVISQSARTHKKVEHVLDMLREAAGLEPGKTKKVVR
jgi:hypothetical protein